MKRVAINNRSNIIIVLLVLVCILIAITTCIIYRYKMYNLLISKPKTENYVDCTDDLAGLTDYYNANGIGQMQISGSRLYDNGARDAMIYIDGINSIPDANTSMLMIIDYLEAGEAPLFNDTFYLHICMLCGGETITNNRASMIEFELELSNPSATTVYLQEESIISSIGYENVPLDVEVVNVNATNELTLEELTVLEQNYPDADYALP